MQMRVPAGARPLVLGASVLAGVAVLGAHQGLVFRAQANYVEVDAVATDRDGRFVPGLTAADFVVREANAPRPIETFTSVDLPTPGHPASGPMAPARLNPELGVPDNAIEGRIYLLYFSSGDALERLRARDLGRQFVTATMQQGDIAAVWDSETEGVDLVFTTDQAALLKSLDRVGDYGTAKGQEHGGDQTGRLQRAVDWFGSIQGRRKSLLLFSAGWPTLTVAVPAANTSPSIDQTLTLQALDWFTGMRGSPHPRGFDAFSSPADVTGRADVHIYTIDTRGLAAPPLRGLTGPNQASNDVVLAAAQVSADLDALSAGIDAMRSIADETGGLAVVNSNDFRAGFQRIADDNSRYYILGYSTPRRDKSGDFVRIEVKSTRPGVTVRARKGYVAR